jgi:hypothetical protein
MHGSNLTSVMRRNDIFEFCRIASEELVPKAIKQL